MKVWPFYLRLERDFIITLNYASFSDDNGLTYSIEYEREILSICSEFDILCKYLCKELDPAANPRKIYEYYPILSQIEGFMESKVQSESFARVVEPFTGWNMKDSPDWWTSYNKIKHDRIKNDNYKLGNQGNAFMALTGLYAINRHYAKYVFKGQQLNEPIPHSQLYVMADWPIHIPIGGGYMKEIHPDGGFSIC